VEQINGTQEQITANIIVSAATAAAKAVAEAASAAATVMAKENNTICLDIALLKAEINTIKNQQTSFEVEIGKRMDKFDMTFTEMFKQLSEIAKGRPPWAVTVIITVLSCVCVGLITYVATH
jgi:hypothetical protein